MKSQTIIKTHPNGEIQRYQVVSAFKWEELRFHCPGFDVRSISEIARLYRINIVRKHPRYFGTLVFFNLPDGMAHPFGHRIGTQVLYSANVSASITLNALAGEAVLSYDGSFVCDDSRIVQFLNKLQMEGLLEIVSGEGEGLRFLPLSSRLGFASQVDSALAVNTHFFLMDPTDLDSPYCELGTPYGLMLKDGVVMMPPLNGRPCFVVDRSGRSHIQSFTLDDLGVEVDGVVYTNNKNARFYSRTSHRVTPPSSGSDVVIVEGRVVAVNDGGETTIPMAGFVLSLDSKIEVRDGTVRYHGLEEYLFGIQVGPSMMRDGMMVSHLDCPFYDGERDPIPFPSTVYPLPFESARAARIAIGSDDSHEPVLIWAEGASKCRYVAGVCSTGSSLLELALFSEEQGYEDVLNLDGGGSAQILMDRKRTLYISDRYDDDTEAERPVPMLLVINS